MVNVRSANAAAALISALASVAVAADPYALNSDSDITNAAGVLAGDVIKQFKAVEDKKHPGLMKEASDDPFTDEVEYSIANAAMMWYSMVQYGHYTGNDTYNEQVSSALESRKVDNFFKAPYKADLNEPSFEEPLWGLALMAAAERGLPSKSKDSSQWATDAGKVFETVMSRWDEKVCKGGLLEIDDEFSKWTTNNALVFNLAARLARYSGDRKYSNWAVKIWNWLEGSGLVNKDYVVSGGFGEGGKCTPTDLQSSQDNAWLVGGAAFMYSLTDDDTWKTRVDGLVKDGLKRFTTDKTLYDVVCPEDEDRGCPFDLETYKSTFHDNYALASKLIPDTAKTIMPKLQTAAKAALKSCKGDGTFHDCEVDNLHNDFEPAPYFRGIMSQLDVMNSVTSLLVDSSKMPLRAKDHGETSSNNKGQDNKGQDNKDSNDSNSKSKDSNESSAGLKTQTSIWAIAAVAISLIAIAM